MTCEVVESRYNRILFQVEFDSATSPSAKHLFSLHNPSECSMRKKGLVARKADDLGNMPHMRDYDVSDGKGITRFWHSHQGGLAFAPT
jgi:hypothetical protein